MGSFALGVPFHLGPATLKFRQLIACPTESIEQFRVALIFLVF